MKKLILSCTIFWAASVSTFAQAGATAVPALIAHNAAHKVEHLVGLRQIDEHFQDRFYSVQLVALAPANPTDPAFNAIVSQVPDSSGKAQQVGILLDRAGKTLSFHAMEGPPSANAPVWPDADALTLGEDGLHYLLDNIAQHPELKPFHSGLTGLTLSQVQDANSHSLALVQIHSKETQAILEVYLKLDGTLDSAKVINP